MSQELLDRELNDCLRSELTWKDVAEGLTKILTGYFIWIAGNLFGLMLVLMPLIQVGFRIQTARLGIGQLWMFYAGLGIISLSGLFACGTILTGKWRCILGASERNGCRWLMFFCMASLFMSVALSVLSSLAGVKVQPEFHRGVVGFQQMRFSTVGVIYNLCTVGLSMAYTCAFALFLRAAAQCMDSRWHVRMVDLFLAFFVPLTLATVYLIYKQLTSQELLLKPFLLVGAGWVVCYVFWLTMIALVRSCILKTIKRVREPMAYTTVAAPKRNLSYS